MRNLFLTFVLFTGIQASWAQFGFHAGETVTIAVDENEGRVVHTALDLFRRDYQQVFSGEVNEKSSGADIVVATLGNSRLLHTVNAEVMLPEGKKQAFLMKVLPEGRLLIVGSDAHGTAYGIMELSRMIGVSPWEWWADATPEKKASFKLPEDYVSVHFPSVEYRGIFINDEDWGLMPWSSRNYEPWHKSGRIGPRTNERIFELMLRLRANYYWPAMHECTQPFFLTEGNREMAEKYGIYIGGSHCEPMASSTAVEWGRRGKGDYDYVNNPQQVYSFWEERLKEVAGQEILYTLGMRGVHDGQMNGAKTVEEQKSVLERVLKDQRGLLRQYVNPDVTRVPQVFIPYKEVLDVYRSGLQVPEDVCLMWCDDNYGYIRHFPTPEERARKGGNGIYYHVSYWGRPHDYLWLGTFSPSLLYQQMKQAYDSGIQRIWMLNVGDIKPAEYQIELFLDMAWDMEQVVREGVSAHLERFLKREFGDRTGEALLLVMQEHYRLAYVRKPEFMGNTREEEYHDKTYYRMVKDLPWDRRFIQRRLDDYRRISDEVERLFKRVPAHRWDTYFQLVKYPVQASCEMNKKMLYAQFARHGEMNWDKSATAYDSIVALTRIYNTGFTNKGKWQYIMSHQPRRLPVFKPVPLALVSEPILEPRACLRQWNATECTEGAPVPCEGLGYEAKAACIPKDKELAFRFRGGVSDSVEVEIALLPNHPMTGEGKLRIAVTLDNGPSRVVSYHTKGRSEEWKENVLRNQAVKRVTCLAGEKKSHLLVIKALDEGVVLDQVRLYSLE